jgi:DNA methylase
MTEINQLLPEDRAFHDWYRFVLAFPPHLVRTYLDRFQVRPGQLVLDPFCGTGTTNVECARRGVGSYGIEANPLAAFAAQVKTHRRSRPPSVLAAAEQVGLLADSLLASTHRRTRFTLPPAAAQLLLAGSINPGALHQLLAIRTALLTEGLIECERIKDLLGLALATTAVRDGSNLKFGPEVGVGPRRVVGNLIQAWLVRVRRMAADLAALRGGAGEPAAVIYEADARHGAAALPERVRVQAVITSPPYPNEKDYTRATRLESVLLGFIADRADLRAIKAGLVRSNTRGVYRGDTDADAVAQQPEINRLAAAIEARRIELGKTSGFERQYARVVRLYFGGLYRHLAALRSSLAPGAQLAYVVGEQASFLRVLIRTGTILADLATGPGYEVTGIDLFRERLATATRAQLREEVVLLRWPGKKL